MNKVKILTHPFAIIISFLVIIISGQHLGAPYLVYILMALPHAGLHSLFAVAGIVLLLLGHYKLKRSDLYFIYHLINFTGLILLLLSLFFFFYNDKDGYNYGTFYQGIPILTLTVFLFISVSFLINNLLSLFKYKKF